MLWFKFIDSLGEQGLIGPVPLFGVFGGDKHTPIITETSIFNRSTFTSILEQGGVTGSDISATAKIVLLDNTNLSDATSTGYVSTNLLNDTESISDNIGANGWTFGGTSNGNNITLTDGSGDDLMESVIYSTPAQKLEKINGSPVSNSNLTGIFTNVLNEYYTFSIFISYGSMTNSPATGQPTTTLKIDDGNANTGAQCTMNIKWNSDGTIDTTSLGGLGKVKAGYDVIKVGGRTWYHIYITNQMKVASGTGKIHIWPCGWVDTSPPPVGADLVPATGHIYLCHPQVEKGKHYTSYTPRYGQTDADVKTLPSLLAGQKSSNMVAPIASNQIVFNAESNTPLAEFSKGRNKIYFSAEDYYSKSLVYRDNDFTGNKLRLLKAYPRFPISWTENDLIISELSTPSVTVRQNPGQYSEVYVPIRDNKHSWKIQFKQQMDLIDNTIVTLNGGEPRNEKVWDEKPVHLSSKLVQLSEKGVASWSYADNWAEPAGYFVKEASNCTILLNYDLTVVDVNKDRGLVLFEEDIPDDLTITYCLDNSWRVIPVELNPLLNNEIPKEIGIKINNRGHILYELDGDGALLSNGEVYSNELGIYETYDLMSLVSMEWGKPEVIDVRREGGMLINKDSDSHSLRDHTVFGFMGVDPAQLHVAVVKMPDKALENLIYQFEESHFQYDETAPFSYPLDWENNRQTYIDFVKAPVESTTQNNKIKDELFLYCKRHMPAGIRMAITDKFNNLIGIN